MAGVPTEERHREILSLVRTRGYVSNEDLAQRLRVAVQTIRRDVNHLAGCGLLTRHHGGAGLVSSIENIAYAERQILNRREKEAIGQVAAREIPDNSSLFINIGTTTEAFARALRHHRALRIITNNLHVASTLAPQSDFRVVIAGGTVRSHDGGITGPTATALIDQYRADFGVIGISGIEEDGTLLDFDLDEIDLAQAIMRNARTIFLLADHTKFGRRPMGRVGHLSDVQALFTDRAPPPAVRAILDAHRVALHIAES
ncbi:transcriptional regulator, DeoR family [Gluconacetobacter diazotrophicus PA1 5]|uniref:Glycerol-3-phosphate regulon repressor n=2 Tax=Gluconacetobacter diazotrophicus TaxID=33996 RepID=A9HHX5_GLUDA|nr:DeoR/GlpR family DNA-binding transcription regulator [Gluconacetobacter diazotrophicus]ACI53253.1 transcriptional regulator, DeoR family [Gluconacetobacter diazotrophicus PA1 5]MBB2155995.1 DeoR/GlpR transcriptional regulator [Gluconacetobacter diazotrophicus]TWB10370.1 DeoR family transcriptional regulator [Gluconacetobacter diazotrophicus]CAP55693.1 Glycerol-3-phosphate regulon repressor [Gluconacetobacter diazotrophicus PA1 5]